tara:strand:- start:112 stop:750 length:639 start_codon:yes stop_codon:yes gene_type:complete
MPHEISGGQRQRVALARSLIVEPSVLLLDEPLGALDASLRKNMQSELKKIHSDIGITFVYVTHDQEEALSMSTKIVLMNKGKIEQMSRPVDLYNSPKSSFAAKFMGFSNIFSIKNRDKLDISNFFNTLENNDIENQRICFRSNNVNFKTDNSGEFKVVSKQYFGGMYQIEVSNNKNILINLMSDETISNGIKIGDSLSLSIESKDIILLEDK